MSVIVEAEPAEITWDKSGIVVVYGTETEWCDERLGRRLRIWGNDERAS